MPLMPLVFVLDRTTTSQ